MTVAFRAGIAVLKREGFEADAEAILQSKAFNVAHRVQLNNAEWARPPRLTAEAIAPRTIRLVAAASLRPPDGRSGSCHGISTA